MSLATRSRARELMDDREYPQPVVDEVYRFLGAIGRWLGGTHATLTRFAELSQSWRPGQRIELRPVKRQDQRE